MGRENGKFVLFWEGLGEQREERREGLGFANSSNPTRQWAVGGGREQRQYKGGGRQKLRGTVTPPASGQ